MVVSVFSSRELAFMTWSVIVLIWICFSQKLRHSLRNILKAFFAIKLQVLFIGGIYLFRINTHIDYGIHPLG